MFRRKSLDYIVGGFHRLIADLEALHAKHDQAHAVIDAQIADLSVQRDGLVAEKAQAKAIAANVRSLIAAS